MTPTQPLTCCPHCGGVAGYITDIRFKAVRIYTWDAKDVDTESYEIISEVRPRCNDCGKQLIKHFSDY